MKSSSLLYNPIYHSFSLELVFLFWLAMFTNSLPNIIYNDYFPYIITWSSLLFKFSQICV